MQITMKAARANKELSLERVSKLMKTSVSTVHRWETGKIPIPNEKLQEFCKICEVEKSLVTANIKSEKE